MKTQEKHDMSGSKLTGREIAAYFKKNPKANKVYQAVVFALDHGGAMTYAIKGIEKMKRGLSKHPEVKKALDYANYGEESVAVSKFKEIVTENYTKNFELLCQSLKFNPIQSKILDSFIHKGQIKDQYVGRIAGTSKNSRIYAGSKKFSGSIENRKEALMQALKVNAKQKSILDSYLKTGKVIGKYTGSIAGSSKPTNKYAGFKGFKESYDLLEASITTSVSDHPDEPIAKGAKRYGVKVKIKKGHGDGLAGEDLATFTGPDAGLIKLFKNHFDGQGKTVKDLKKEFESVQHEAVNELNPTSYVSREGKKIIQKYKKEIKAANKAKNLAIAFDKLGDAAYQAIGNMLSNDGTIKTDDPDEWDKEIGDWVSFVKV